jgi:hypothetical protein
MSNTERGPLARTRPLTIPSRFRGPSGVGNGGYVCGRIAGYLDGPATVTLRRPPPLASPMSAGALWLTVPRPVSAAAPEGTS